MSTSTQFLVSRGGLLFMEATGLEMLNVENQQEMLSNADKCGEMFSYEKCSATFIQNR